MAASLATSDGLAVALTERLARRVLATGVPASRAEAAAAVRRLVPTEAPLAGPEDIESVVDRLVGLGPIESLLSEAGVTDVLVNGPDEIWVERHGELVRTGLAFPGAESVVAAVERAIAPLGLRLDRAR